MAEKKKDRDDKEPPAPPAEPAPAAAQAEVTLLDETVPAAYTNFARVTGTPEEVIVDLALNPNPFATGKQTLRVAQRLIMNYYTAKRLLAALQVTVQRHEKAFGAVELDVRRRVASR